MVITTQDTNSNSSTKIKSHSCQSSSLIGLLPFTRTGKRGVPQQFPRRLYEMLDGETNISEQGSNSNDDDHPVRNNVIEWSPSGKAFRILNVEAFSTTVLPKYFRTKKFSSFQRNLNLYGFTKIRRGVDTDMYAHPGFCRNAPEALLTLRKIATARRRDTSTTTMTSNTSSCTASNRRTNTTAAGGRPRRTVSPTTSMTDPPTPSPLLVFDFGQRPMDDTTTTTTTNTSQNIPTMVVSQPSSSVATTTTSDQNHSYYHCTTTMTTTTTSAPTNIVHDDWGKLDLLALAMEQEFAKGTFAL